MKHIYLNLKRFDIPAEYGGVNHISDIHTYGKAVVESVEEGLKQYAPEEADFTVFFQEAHLLSALAARSADSPLQIGAQSADRGDTAVGGNFGAFTSRRPASALAAMGCEAVMIGHCEERNEKRALLEAAGVSDETAASVINAALNDEILQALNRGLKVLYCIGERSEETERWQSVLQEQIETGLKGADRSRVVIAYEPVWSIGPGKTPADKAYIEKIARFIQSLDPQLEVVYGGGLKAENAAMLASIPEISGGLIALTRFSGEIGFYPEEYLEIIRLYLGK
ncbi:MAG: triosephosphate isomerase [Solobacterium sp.]|nr:triosephosphate isomerase [Solobacterium sp.]